MKTVTTKEHFWKLRDKCNQGKHKFRDNSFGVTFCVVCGQISLKPCNIPLAEEDKIITTDLF